MRYNILIPRDSITAWMIASAVLLKSHYVYLELQYWTKYKNRWLRNRLKRHGKLVCEYCGREDLIIPKKHVKTCAKNFATIDHVIPLSRGGPKFDTTNFAVACRTCNNRKGEKLVEQMENANAKD